MTAQALLLGYGAARDPHFANVVLLVGNDNAANGTTTFLDQSASGKTITRFGNTVYSSARAPTGMTTSLLFDGTGDKVSAATSADFAIGTGDATIDFMVWRENTSDQIDFDLRGGGILGAGGNGGTYLSNSSGAVQITATAMTLSTWYHLAYVRASNVWTLYINGVPFGTTWTNSTNYNTNTACSVGGGFEGSGFSSWNGNISNFRFTKGVARWTSSFTPPTLPLPTA